MSKVIVFLFGLLLIGCKATPEIINKNNPKGYIIKDNNATPLAEVVEITVQPLDISAWWIVWFICFIALVVYVIKFIKLFNN